MGLIDFHSHILPGIDDGAENMQEALSLLQQEKDQGVSHVICTPHFYPEYQDFEEFSKKAQNAFSALCCETSCGDYPSLSLGCELHFFSGMHHSFLSDSFCPAKTNLLLVELPFLSPVPEAAITALQKLHEDVGFDVVLAHIERYADDRQYKKLLKLVRNGTVSAQINADSLMTEQTKRAAHKLLKQNLISYVGSDAHHSIRRPVHINTFMQTVHENYPQAYFSILHKTMELEERLKGVNHA